MQKQCVFITLICFIVLTFTGCDKTTQNGLNETEMYSDASNAPTSDIESPMETDSGIGSYMAQMNFVERRISESGSDDYVPFSDRIVYNGGEFDLYAEFLFSGDRKSVKNMNAIALLFIDGYAQEFSLDNSEKALVQSLTVSNNEPARIHLSFIPTTYDESSSKHTIITVILPKWVASSDNFVRDTVIMAVGREITLNTINVPGENYIVKMDTRKKTEWDLNHSELPFKQDGSNTNLIFHCFNQGESNCYLICNGNLLSQDGKFIFAANNQDSDTVSYLGFSMNKSDVGNPLYVLYIPKNYQDTAMVERSCNYVWD